VRDVGSSGRWTRSDGWRNSSASQQGLSHSHGRPLRNGAVAVRDSAEAAPVRYRQFPGQGRASPNRAITLEASPNAHPKTNRSWTSGLARRCRSGMFAKLLKPPGNRRTRARAASDNGRHQWAGGSSTGPVRGAHGTANPCSPPAPPAAIRMCRTSLGGGWATSTGNATGSRDRSPPSRCRRRPLGNPHRARERSSNVTADPGHRRRANRYPSPEMAPGGQYVCVAESDMAAPAAADGSTLLPATIAVAPTPVARPTGALRARG